jgi:hypothetical protein
VNSGETQQTSYWPCPTIPAGQLVYASIQTKFGSLWKTSDITFTASTAAPACGASLAFPGNGATNADLTQGFSWVGVPHTTVYKLTVGTTAGGADVVNTNELPSTQTLVTAYDLPVGRLLYARLWTRHENVWYTSDSSFTLATVAVARATFINPTDRAIQVDSAPAFKWTAVPNAQAYYLYVGTTVGANNLVNTGEIQATTYSAPTLPANVTLYARLWTKLGGVWRYVDITFSVRPPGVAATGCSAQPGSVVYAQNWSRGIAPIAMRPSYYTTALFGGTDPIDPVYPEILGSRDVTVVSGAGPSSENVLDLHPAARWGYQAAWVGLGGFGPISDPAGGPSSWDASEGCVSASFKWTTVGWDLPMTYASSRFLAIGQSDAQLLFGANRADTERGTFNLTYSTWTVEYDPPYLNHIVDTYPFTRAATENVWHAIEMRWKLGTTDAAARVASDGWVRVYVNGTLIYNVENIPLVVHDNANAPAGKPNLLRYAFLGGGLLGPTTNLEVMDTSGVAVPPSADCAFIVSPQYLSLGSGGGSESIQVTAPSGCQSSVTSDSTWVDLSTVQGDGSWTTTVTAGPHQDEIDSRIATLHIAGTVVLIEQIGTIDPLTAFSNQIDISICGDDCQPPQSPPPPAGIPIVSTNCGASDCDGDGLNDADEKSLAYRWLPNIHSISPDCGMLLFRGDGKANKNQPVIFRAHYMSHDGVVDPTHIAIFYQLLYRLDCGFPGDWYQNTPARLVADEFGAAHKGDNEPFVVFLVKAPDGSWDTPASFDGIAASAHAHTSGEVFSKSMLLNGYGRPDLWVGFDKHGNFAELSKCAPDSINRCAQPGFGFQYPRELFNVGERLAPFIDDLGAIVPIWSGQTVWGCHKFYDAGIIADDLYLRTFGPNLPPEQTWDDGDIDPTTGQVLSRHLCGQ